jgi:CO dehydrogenase/acetyl-CoA synthase beta subunit
VSAVVFEDGSRFEPDVVIFCTGFEPRVSFLDEALVEHAGAKDLIFQLQAMDVKDDLFDAKVTVLGEQIDHHVKEEEGDMFPKAKKAKVDLADQESGGRGHRDAQSILSRGDSRSRRRCVRDE